MSIENLSKEEKTINSVPAPRPPRFLPNTKIDTSNLTKGEILKAGELFLNQTKAAALSAMNETILQPIQPHLEQLKQDLNPLINFLEEHPAYRAGLIALGSVAGLAIASYCAVSFGLYIIYLMA